MHPPTIIYKSMSGQPKRKILGLLLKTLVLSKMTKNWSNFAFPFGLVNSRVKKLHVHELSRNQLILRFEVILQHDWPTEQRLLHIRVFFGGKNEEAMFWCFDKTNNEHLPKQFFKVIGKSLYLYFGVASMKRKFRLRIFRRRPHVSRYLWRQIFSPF